MNTKYLKVGLFDCGSQVAVMVGPTPLKCLVLRFKNPFFKAWK